MIYIHEIINFDVLVSPRTRKRAKIVDEEEEDLSNYKSLDVLAQVATETLQSEPKKSNKKVLIFHNSSSFFNFFLLGPGSLAELR